MVTILEVIDTAVKIGLGALISGTATYWVTRAKNKHEKEKEVSEDKRNILKEISLKIETSTDLLNDFVHLSYSVDADIAKERMQNAVNNLIDAHKEAYRAEALANLIGCLELASAIYAFDKLLQDFHNTIASDINNIDKIGNKMIGEINKMEKKIKPLLTKSFAELCA